MTETTATNSTTERREQAKARGDIFARAYAAFSGLPRVGKWVALAAVGYLVFLLFQFVVWPTADKLELRAERASRVLKAAAGRAEELPQDTIDRALVFGPNAIPGRDIAEKERFSNAIAAIMKKHGVADSYGFDARPQGLPSAILPRVAAQYGGTMARTVAEVKFTAGPEAVSAVISDIDRSPFVDAITDVRLTYKDRRVSAVLSVERWGVEVKGGPR